MKSLDYYLNLAREIAHQVGDLLVESFGQNQELIYHPADGDLNYSIELDKKANDLYEQFLKKHTQEIALMTEEGEQRLSEEMMWVVDPLDGSSNFKAGIPLFNTQITLIKQKEPVVTVIYLPLLNEEYSAKKSGGAFLNGQPIKVSDLTGLNKAMLALGKGHTQQSLVGMSQILSQFSEKIRSVRIFSSDGVDLAYVAAGKIDLYILNEAYLWDLAPGVLLVREAGGKVVNLDGHEWGIEDNSLIAGNSELVDQALKVLAG
jgi:myo-inositol-1(or 4)-monophosphatase